MFAKLGAKAFQRCFIVWVERFTEALRGVVSIDAKTLRRRPGSNPDDLGVEYPRAAGVGLAASGGQVQRDHGDPEALGPELAEGC